MYSSLPGGRRLEDKQLQETLTSFMESQVCQKSEMLSNLGSTQANENFNNIVASKAPKNRYYYSKLIVYISYISTRKNEMCNLKYM